MNTTCEHCEKAVPVRRKPLRFCSRRCAARVHAAITRKPRATCICGKSASEPNGKSCSKPCGYLSRKLRRMKPLTCPVCQKQHWPKGSIRLKYCSIQCYNKKRAEYWSPVALKCKQCGTKVTRAKGILKHRSKNAFCSHSCFAKWHVGENHALYRGDLDPNRGQRWVRLSESIRARDNHKCRRCGMTQLDNKRRLSVDHILPWRSFQNKAEANNPINLTSLCAKCHAYKTTVIERAWLAGDVLLLRQYQRAVGLPGLFDGSLT